MKSKWFEYKSETIRLRKKGISITEIEKKFSIPRSTLSGWFKGIDLSEKQKRALSDRKREVLIHARKKAVVWHNKQKELRLQEAERSARETFERLDIGNISVLELAAAILYLGEGAKKNVETSLGSSDPLILKFFLKILRTVYGVEDGKIRCELYLRADQDPAQIKHFWSKELHLPLENFRQVNIDKRTAGTVTYDGYKGVCNIRCGNVAIQRKLIALSRLFCEGIVIKG